MVIAAAAAGPTVWASDICHLFGLSVKCDIVWMLITKHHYPYLTWVRDARAVLHMTPQKIGGQFQWAY